jgi:hypothetical protein
MCENGLWLEALNPATKQARIFRTDCDKWQCVECGPRKARTWAKRAWFGVEQYQKADGVNSWHMVTLTMKSYRRGTENGLADLKSGWPRLYARMKRIQPTIRFIMIPELHPRDGVSVHVHVLTDFARDNTYTGCGKYRKLWRIKDAAHGAGFGYIADVKPIEDAGKASFYVSKYLTKSLPETDWPTKFRRVRSSQNWPVLERVGSNPDWDYTVLHEKPSSAALEMLKLMGYTVYSEWTMNRFEPDV